MPVEDHSFSWWWMTMDWQSVGCLRWWRCRRGTIGIWGELMSYSSLFITCIINIIPHKHTPQFFRLHKDPMWSTYQQLSPSPACSGFLISAFTIALDIAEAGTKIGTKGFRVSPEMVDTSKSIQGNIFLLGKSGAFLGIGGKGKMRRKTIFNL